MVAEDYVSQFRERLTALRLEKDISESRMSRELSQSKGYLQQISSGKSLPSLKAFFAICDYFDLTPQEFFDMDAADPLRLKELSDYAKGLSRDDMEFLITTARFLKERTQEKPE